jgi:hypothetical protein
MRHGVTLRLEFVGPASAGIENTKILRDSEVLRVLYCTGTVL